MDFRALEKSIGVLEKPWKSPGNLFLNKGTNPESGLHDRNMGLQIGKVILEQAVIGTACRHSLSDIIDHLTGSGPKSQTMQIADWSDSLLMFLKLQNSVQFFLFLFLYLLLTRTFFGSGHKLVFNYEWLLKRDRHHAKKRSIWKDHRKRNSI